MSQTPSLSWEQAHTFLCPPCKESGQLSAEVDAAGRQCAKSVDGAICVTKALMPSGEPYLFINEKAEPKVLWGFADDFAFSATITGGGFAIVFYKPSRDFRKVEVAETSSAGQPRIVIVKAEGPQGHFELHATGNNCDALYGALPYMLGCAATKPPAAADKA